MGGEHETGRVVDDARADAAAGLQPAEDLDVDYGRAEGGGHRSRTTLFRLGAATVGVVVAPSSRCESQRAAPARTRTTTVSP